METASRAFSGCRYPADATRYHPRYGCPYCPDPHNGGRELSELQQIEEAPPASSNDVLSNDLVAEVRFTIRRNEAEQKRLRRMILDLNEAGVTQRELARRIGVPLGTLTHWIRSAKQDRGDAPRRR